MKANFTLQEKTEIIKQNRKLFDAVWVNGHRCEEAKELEKRIKAMNRFFNQTTERADMMRAFMRVYMVIIEKERMEEVVGTKYILPNEPKKEITEKERIRQFNKTYHDAWAFLEQTYFKQNEL